MLPNNTKIYINNSLKALKAILDNKEWFVGDLTTVCKIIKIPANFN